MADLSKVIKLTQGQYNTLASGGTVGSYTGLDPTFLYLVEDMGEIIDVSNGVDADIKEYLIAHPSTLLKYGDYIYVAQYLSASLGSEAPSYYNCFEGDDGTFRYLVIDWTDYTINSSSRQYLSDTDTAYDSSRLGGHAASYFLDTSSTAQTKTGNLTLSGTTDVSSGTLKLKTVNAPTTSGGTTFGPGTSGQVLKSNGTTVYWASDSNSDTWRNVKVDGTEKLGTATNTGALDFLSQNTNNGDVSFTYDSTNKGIKATAKMPTSLKNPYSLGIKVNSESSAFVTYDGSAAKTLTVAPSSTSGAFTISDGTTTKTIQLAGTFTDNNQKVKAGSVTFGNNDVVNFVGGGATTVTGASTGDGAPKITISSVDSYHKTGSWNGLTYTATAVGNAEVLAFTIPTGTTSSTVAAGNHNHSGVYQPLDADLTAIAGLSGTSGFLKKTAANTWELQNSPQILDDDAVIFKQSTGQHEDVRLSRKTIGGTSTTGADYNLLKLIGSNDGSSIKTGVAFWNYIITADTNTDDTNYRYFKLPTKNAGTYTLATTSDIPTVTNYYWADVKVASSSNKGTTPTVSTLTIGGSGSTAGKATMQYNSTEDCIEFVFA